MAAPIHLIGLATANPPLRLSQKQSLDFILSEFKVRDSTRSLYRRIFANNAIASRTFALTGLKEVLEADHDKINARFEKRAVELSTQALSGAMASTGLRPRDLDYLAVTTCTGYLCPGLSSYLVDHCDLRPNLRHIDIVGMGCGAALPALEQAANFLNAHPQGNAAVVATEICSAAMFSGDSPDLIISNAIFADGSSAAILSSAAKPARVKASLRGFASIIVPKWRDTLRFRTEKGYLRNVLKKEVPAQVGSAIQQLIPQLLEPRGLSQADIGHWFFHAGGEKVLDAIEESLALTPAHMRVSREIFKEYGNMSSPTVLYALKRGLAQRRSMAGQYGVLASFGAGFSAHAALLEF